MVASSDSPKMLYQQVYDALSDAVNCGLYKPGDMIPSEKELTESYGVSRVTVRKALDLMAREGTLVKKKGRGTFVASPAFVESPQANGSFTRSCMDKGVTPRTKLVSRKVVWASKAVARQLCLAEGDSVLLVARLRLMDDVPAILEYDYFPQELAFLLEADVTSRPILDVIYEGCGRMGHRHLDTFEVGYADKEKALLLGCRPNAALLRVNMTVFDEQDAPLYYNEEFIRSEIYKYAMSN
jgi:GntR family transcriptional regulator